ncbi:unnamed protein product [Brassicogethes aeneus]|uniref:Uncharacterized protein n=1 Tax=Brassicogethes aeneus TaxID=1431903 RepID=A0A9P0AV45_BRAAE|nr:unnamed protein product [Brassicogethes aeneus]
MRKTLRTKNDVEISLTNSYTQNIDKSWSKRNNSNNVCSVLHPEILVSKKVAKKHGECYKNKCYCKEKKIRPKLFKTAKSKICSDSSSSLYRSKSKLSKNDDAKKTYEDFKEERQKNKHKCLNESFTPQRLMYEDYVHDKNLNCACYFHNQAEELYRKYFNIKKNVKKEDIENKNKISLTTLYRPSNYSLCTEYTANTPKTIHSTDTYTFLPEEEEEENETLKSSYSLPESTKPSNTITTKPSTKHYNSLLTSSEEKLKKMKDFREKHFFETHQTPSDEKNKAKPHKCIYRFSLDERLAAIPLDADNFGFNRCIICDKPMENWQKNTTMNKRGPLESLTDLKPRDLTAKQVHLGNNANFEFRLTERDVQLFNDCFKQRIKRPEYRNTLALRQQKMYG